MTVLDDVDDKITPFVERVSELIKDLQDGKTTWRGTWNAVTDYNKGDVLIHEGKVYTALDDMVAGAGTPVLSKTFDVGADNHVAWYGCTAARSTADPQAGAGAYRVTQSADSSGVQLDNYPYFVGVGAGVSFQPTLYRKEISGVMPDVTWTIRFHTNTGTEVGTPVVMTVPRSATHQQFIGDVAIAPVGAVRMSWTFTTLLGSGSVWQVDSIVILDVSSSLTEPGTAPDLWELMFFGVGSQVDAYIADATWAKPVWAKTVDAAVIGPGGGGASGCRRVTGTAYSGGGAGAGGGYSFRAGLNAAALGATEAVTVPAGGAGGAAITANDTTGAVGSPGAGIASFGNHVKAALGPGGAGGNAGTAAGGIATAGAILPGTNGGAGAAGAVGAAGVSSANGGTGGGGGGGISVANAKFNGGAGGINTTTTNTAAAGGTAATVGHGAAGYSPGQLGGPGSGGGGGAASVTGVAGNGGAGGFPGGGGGGGGSAHNGNNSGAGGAGAGAFVLVVSHP